MKIRNTLIIFFILVFVNIDGVALKVLHINSFYKKGGAETVFQITKKISGIENYSGYTFSDSKEEQPSIQFFSWEHNKKLLGIINYIFSIKNYIALNNFLERNKFDVIHLHGFFAALSPSILLAIKKAKRSNKLKVVQTLHDFHIVCPNASLYHFNKNEVCEKCLGKKLKLNVFCNNCDRRGYLHSVIKGIRSIIANNLLHHRDIVDKFICPSEFIRNKLLQDNIKENKIVLIRNPIILGEQKPITQKKNIICYFGRFSKEKNLEFLIDAFTKWNEKKKNDFQLLLIGDGEEKGGLINYASLSSTKEQIVFKDFMPFEKLVEEIKYAKYFALTSKCYENAPMSIIEAFTLNIIPIAPNIGGMKESIESTYGIGKTFKVNDKESWVESITALEKNYDLIIEKINLTKSKLMNELRVEKYYEAIYNEYKNI